MKGTTLTGSKDAPRREADFYPTPPDVTHALMRFLTSRAILDRRQPIWEPACGDGAITRVITEKYWIHVVSSDIRAEEPIDFLSTPKQNGFDAIITNPPFNLSEAFIRHAVPQARVVAMLLKSQYWHAKSRLQLFELFPPAWVLPLTWRPDFMFDLRKEGERSAPTMDVQWSVWIKGQHETRYLPLVNPKIAV